MPEKTRILLVDDHPLLMDGVRTWLETYDHLEVVAQVNSAEEALDQIEQLHPDVAFVDIGLPGMNGLELTSQLRQIRPDIKVIVLTVYDNKEYVRQALRLGAWGYLLKSAPSSELAEAIEAVREGRKYFSKTVHEQILRDFTTEEEESPSTPLTPRQTQILIEVARGKTNKQIAAEFDLSPRTVETHRENIMKKLGLHSTAELTHYALSRGLL